MLEDTRKPIPIAPGRVRRVDYEYRRNGTGNVFTTVEPLAGWRHLEVTERRTAVDFARVVTKPASLRAPCPQKSAKA